ncbi:MAG: hypothetical protein ACT4PU_00785 [Planctomycetota bacterium]
MTTAPRAPARGTALRWAGGAVCALLLCAPAASALQVSPAEELAKRVRTQLEAVDLALQEAAEAETPAGRIEAARDGHRAAIRDLEELIKQVKYMRSSSPSSGGGGEGDPSSGAQGQGQPSSGAPRERDGDRAPQPQGGEQQPSGTPRPQDGAEEQPAGADGKQPRDGESNAEAADQREGRGLPPDATNPFLRQDTDARWGVLPPKLQERLMNLHVDDVPERYRTWMDAYIRALNRNDRP